MSSAIGPETVIRNTILRDALSLENELTPTVTSMQDAMDPDTNDDKANSDMTQNQGHAQHPDSEILDVQLTPSSCRNGSIITLAQFKPISTATIIPGQIFSFTTSDDDGSNVTSRVGILGSTSSSASRTPRRLPQIDPMKMNQSNGSLEFNDMYISNRHIKSISAFHPIMPSEHVQPELTGENKQPQWNSGTFFLPEVPLSPSITSAPPEACLQNRIPSPIQVPSSSSKATLSGLVNSGKISSYSHLSSETNARVMVRARSKTEVTPPSLFSTRLGTTQTEKRLIELLMLDQCTLLEMICQGSFVGDTAATVSKGVVHLLRSQDPVTADMFLRKIFRQRTMEYVSKGRDLNDIIRDNSMATMLLTAFARAEGTSYLQTVLTSPLRDIYQSLENCEVDPSKLKLKSVLEKQQQQHAKTLDSLNQLTKTDEGTKERASDRDLSGQRTATSNDASNYTEDTILHQLQQNRTNLKQICDRLFNHIFENYEQLPEGLQRIASLLHSTVEEMLIQGVPSDFRARSRSSSVLTTPKTSTLGGVKSSISQTAYLSSRLGRNSTTSDMALSPRASVTQNLMKAFMSGSSEQRESQTSGRKYSTTPNTSSGRSSRVPMSLSAQPFVPEPSSSGSANDKLFELGLKNSPSTPMSSRPSTTATPTNNGRGVFRIISFKKKSQRMSVTVNQPATVIASPASPLLKQEQEVGGDEKSQHKLKDAEDTNSRRDIKNQFERSSSDHSNTASENSFRSPDYHDTQQGRNQSITQDNSDQISNLSVASESSTTTPHYVSSSWLKRGQRTYKGKDKDHDKILQGDRDDVPSSPISPATLQPEQHSEPTVISYQRESTSQFSFRSSVNSDVDIGQSTSKLPPPLTISTVSYNASSLPVIEAITPLNVPLLSFMNSGKDNNSSPVSPSSIKCPSLKKNSLVFTSKTPSKPHSSTPKITPERASSENAIQLLSNKDSVNIPAKALSNPNLLQLGSRPSSAGVGRMAGTLSVSEKVVGSFLFLRFFVPAITSPDTNSIPVEKLNGPKRRGLVLCGKLLTALCNDMEFGSKEDYLMEFNEYLRLYRPKMKEFLQHAIQIRTVEADVDFPLFFDPIHPVIPPLDSECSQTSLHRDATIVKKPSTPKQIIADGSVQAPDKDDQRNKNTMSTLPRKPVLSLSLPSLLDETGNGSKDLSSPKTGELKNVDSAIPTSSNRTRAPTDMPLSSVSRSGRNLHQTSGSIDLPIASNVNSQSNVNSSSKKSSTQEPTIPIPVAQTMTLLRMGKKDKQPSSHQLKSDKTEKDVNDANIPQNLGDPDLTILFQCLLKSIDRIEKDVEEGVAYLAPEAGRHLVFNYQEFRALLESGPYSIDTANSLSRSGSGPGSASSSQASMLANSRKKAYWLNRVLKSTFQMFSRNNSSVQL